MTKGALNRRGLLALGAGLVALGVWGPRAQGPRANAQTASNGAGRVPLQIIRGKVFIDVTVNGRPASAMVDSGAAYSGVDTRFAEAMGLAPKGRKIALRHVQGSSSGRWAQGVKLGVGSAVVERPMLVTDFSLLTASVLHPIVVLLGADFLAMYVAEFDFDAGFLTLHSREAFVAATASVLAPLTPPRGLSGGGTPMTVAVTVEGVIVQALVDTGSQSPLIVSPSTARRMGLLKDRTVSTSPIGGIGGTTAGKITSLRTLGLGGKMFREVPMQVTARDLPQVEANLGLEVLSRFHLWLDLGGGRMWLAPREEQPPFDKNLLGFFGLPDGDTDIRVTFVAKDSPAEAAGIRMGDIIATINAQPANAAQLALVGAPPGTRLDLRLRNGQSRTLALAPYY